MNDLGRYLPDWLRGVGRTALVVGRAKPWKPSHARLFWRDLLAADDGGSGRDDGHHLREAVSWIRAAQDIHDDGGFAGRYSLREGWTSSYPETTGYLIPTLLRLAGVWDDSDLERRASRAVAFLLELQLRNGAFPAFEVSENRTEPSVFNTAQIVCGLDAWHEYAGDDEVLLAARRAADWLVEIQENDGAWRRHSYEGVARAYYAHAACWLARLGDRMECRRYLRAAEDNLNWVLSRQDPRTGWFQDAGFHRQAQAGENAETHTIGYTLWGLLLCAERLKRSDGIEQVRFAAEELAEKVLGWEHLPGMLGPGWQARSRYACLTGNAQIAQVWRRLHAMDGDRRLSAAAEMALGEVKSAQISNSRDSRLRGGIPGSRPLWGGYLPFTLPNWAPKFFVDALLEPEG